MGQELCLSHPHSLTNGSSVNVSDSRETHAQREEGLEMSDRVFIDLSSGLVADSLSYEALTS